MIKCTYIILVKNNEEYIARLIQSLQAIQDTFYKEYIFIDDASTDDSLYVLKEEVKKLSRCTIISEKEEHGESVCINKAFNLITGDYIRFVSGDEIIHPISTIALISLSQKFGAEVAYGEVSLGQNQLDQDLSDTFQVIDQPLKAILNNIPSSIRNIGHSGSIVTANIFRKVGGVDNNVYNLSLSLALRCAKYSKFVYHNTIVSAKPKQIKTADEIKFDTYNDLQSIYNFMQNHPEISKIILPELLKALSDAAITNTIRFNCYLKSVSGKYLKNMSLDKVSDIYRKELNKLLK